MLKPIRLPGYYLLLLILLLMPGRLKAGEPLVIDYFFEPGCPECRQVSETILPTLSNLFYGAYILNHRDLGATTNYLALARCQQAANSIKNETVYMAIDETNLFSGLSEIKSGLLAAADEIIRERSGAANPAAGTSSPQTTARSPDPKSIVDYRFRRFTVFGVMLAGLVDSLNPCAISTLVFFVSILTLSGFRKRQVVFAGIWFCGAAFLTYIAIGFGLFRFLHGFSGFPRIQLGLELGMGSVLAVMAALSFYDAWNYRRSENPGSLILRLPLRVKLIMNAIMMRLPKTRHVSLAAFLIGAAVTALETVCTGQVYVPTLVLVIKSGASPVLGLVYLFLYNLMFILPLAIVLALAARGMSVQRLIAWSKREVMVSKIAMACLFMALAFVLIFL